MANTYPTFPEGLTASDHVHLDHLSNVSDRSDDSSDDESRYNELVKEHNEALSTINRMTIENTRKAGEIIRLRRELSYLINVSTFFVFALTSVSGIFAYRYYYDF